MLILYPAATQKSFNPRNKCFSIFFQDKIKTSVKHTPGHHPGYYHKKSPRWASFETIVVQPVQFASRITGTIVLWS